ncbi:hypothetical protein ACQ4OD_22750 [Pseudomonas sp. WC1]|uniref:hypothetical protein n=1 Tax=Pseudomonas sp. WC1 TaxID=3424772 RepID=UPI003D3536FA
MTAELHFTRQTMLAAAVLLERLTGAKFDQMVLRLGLDHVVPQGEQLSVPKKGVVLGTQVLHQPQLLVQAKDGLMSLGEALIREAVAVMSEQRIDEPQENFRRSLARDGFTVSWEEGNCGAGSPPWLRRSMPTSIDMPQNDDEVHRLLTHFGFNTAGRHLDQAIDAHARGDWAAANAQYRTFLEQLVDDIASLHFGTENSALSNLNNRLQLLGGKGYLSQNRGEWAPDGKSFVGGLFKMLHSEGSHPGLSDEDHCTFRLHLVLVTARTLLRRSYHKH